MNTDPTTPRSESGASRILDVAASTIAASCGMEAGERPFNVVLVAQDVLAALYQNYGLDVGFEIRASLFGSSDERGR